MKSSRNVLLSCILVAPLIATAAESGPVNMQYPVDAALFQDPDGNWFYKSFPSGSRLFVFEGDSPGTSRCYQGCASAWPPLYVSSEQAAERVGDWTVIMRDDGRRQWAYKGQPVYRRYHDLPAASEGIEAAGFQLLQP
jgi:predicted lipoprotein with Yx(FWY)xxD motif